MTPPATKSHSKGIRSELARAVRMRRAEKDLSQEEVASMAQTSRKSVVHIEGETGNPTLDTIDRVVNALGIVVQTRAVA